MSRLYLSGVSGDAGCSNAQAEVGSRNDSEEEGQRHIHPQTENDEDYRDEGVQQEGKLQSLLWQTRRHQGLELTSGIHEAEEGV